jgi:zinc transport system permease protein
MTMEALLAHEFMRNALLAGLLSSVACGVIGTYVVIRRLGFIAGGISHTCYGGVGLGYLLGFPPLLGAIGAAVLASLIIGVIDRRLGQHADTVIGVLWAVGMALGIVFIGLAPGYAPDLMSYLFGDILLVPRSDLRMMAVLDAIIIVTVIVLFREFQAISYDEEFATVGNLPVRLLHLLMLVLISMTIVVLIRVVGILLVIAMLTIPPAIARLFCRKITGMMVLAIALGALITIGGLLLSYAMGLRGLNMPSGALIILLAGSLYFLTLALARRRFARGRLQ